MEVRFLDSEPLREADEDAASEVHLNNSTMTEEEREEIQQELVKLEEEIGTLKQVLSSKEKQQAELRQKLGITPLSELKNNFSRSWHDVQTSVAFKKTSETFSTAGQKTSAAFSTFGSAITRKLGDMSNIGAIQLPSRFQENIDLFVFKWMHQNGAEQRAGTPPIAASMSQLQSFSSAPDSKSVLSFNKMPQLQAFHLYKCPLSMDLTAPSSGVVPFLKKWFLFLLSISASQNCDSCCKEFSGYVSQH
uniref:Tpd52 like 1 n=1 Tax=Oryzias sinensis TaxID=183150 RepID=A0A8C7ZM99_9TELE